MDKKQVAQQLSYAIRDDLADNINGQVKYQNVWVNVRKLRYQVWDQFGRVWLELRRVI